MEMSAATELARVENPGSQLTHQAQGLAPLVFTDQDLMVINDTIAKGLSDGERKFFIQACQSAGLNPLLKEIYAWKDGGKLTIHIGIDGLLKIAAEYHPDYVGVEGPYWCGEDGAWREFWPKRLGNPVAAKARILLRGAKTGATTVTWDSFAKPNSPTWKAMPDHMLGVAALRHALRRTCPRAAKRIDALGFTEDGDMSAVTDGLESRITEDPTPALHAGPGSQPAADARSQPGASETQRSTAAAPPKRSATAGLSGTWKDRASAKFSALGGRKETALWHVQQILPGIQFLSQVDDAGWQRVAQAFDAHECLPGEPGWALEADVQDEAPTTPVADDPFAEE